MININFIKQSSTADEIIETNSRRVETAQEDSDDDMRIDTSVTITLHVYSMVKRITKRAFKYLMCPGLAAALDRAKISDRNETYPGRVCRV